MLVSWKHKRFMGKPFANPCVRAVNRTRGPPQLPRSYTDADIYNDSLNE